MIYDYTAAKAAVEAKGLTWLAEIVPEVDKRFGELNLTQAQVDGCMAMYVHYVAWLFTPQSYGFVHRILLACHFLFGRSR